MRILFICSALEPDCDGVGDYVRILATTLNSQGHTTAAISLNDRYISNSFNGTQNIKDINLPVLRLPSAWNINYRLSSAKKYIDEFNPNCLSLQFVAFGFQSKGLPFRLANRLKLLGNGRPWHIMFHELWVGIATEESIKLRWWGKLQKYIIKDLIIKLHPKVIHTQTLLYQKLLLKLGFNVSYLALFGNIPIHDSLKVDNKIYRQTVNPTTINFVIFGSIHSGAPIDKFAEEASVYSKNNNISIILTFIGRCGIEQDRWCNIWRAKGLTAIVMGVKTAEDISDLLVNATMGISATAYEVIEKSGSYAAMREHNLTVLSVAKAWTPKSVATGIKVPGVLEYHPGKFEECINNNITMPYDKKVSSIAKQFINSLSDTINRLNII
jgi:hypothetical protein